MTNACHVETYPRGSRHRLRAVPGLVGALLVLLSACSGAAHQLPATTYQPTPHALPAFSHLFVVVLENREYGDVIGAPDAPYLNRLAQTYGLATASYAISHPSLPNYLALVGGDIFGIQSDCTTCFVHAPNLVDALEAGHKTWTAYMEDLPQSCLVGDAGLYAQKHDPFIYFDDIRTNPARCQHLVPLAPLASELTSGHVPDLVWITPNLCSDMHDCSTATGDAWLAMWVPRILASTAWRDGGALFLTWDEGTTSDGCCQAAHGGHIATLVISPLGKPRYQSHTPYDHYSLLRTITEAWGLRPLGHAADPAARPFVDFFPKA